MWGKRVQSVEGRDDISGRSNKKVGVRNNTEKKEKADHRQLRWGVMLSERGGGEKKHD